MRSSKIGNKVKMSDLLTTIIQHSMRSSRLYNKEKKGNKSIQIGKEEKKLFLFVDDMIVHIGDTNKSTNNNNNNNNFL